MTTNNLTEQWRKGELESGSYYIEYLDGSNHRFTKDYYDEEFECFDNYQYRGIKEVLAPVPSYEEWRDLEDDLVTCDKDLNNVCEQKEELYEENQQLKDLLKECREWIEFMEEKSRADENYKGTMYFKNLLTKIDGVLK